MQSLKNKQNTNNVLRRGWFQLLGYKLSFCGCFVMLVTLCFSIPTYAAPQTNTFYLNKFNLSLTKHSFFAKTAQHQIFFNNNIGGINLCTLATKQSNINFFVSPKTIGLRFALKLGRNK